MEINIGMSECHKNVDNYYGSNITVWIPRCTGREAFDGVEPLPEYKILEHILAYPYFLIFEKCEAPGYKKNAK